MANRNDSRRNSRKDRKKDSVEGQLIATNRITKVIKGGRRIGFAATVIVSGRKGYVGFGTDKAQEVPEAIRKAVEAGKKRVIKVPTAGTTIPHEVVSHHGSGNIMLKPAEAGSSIAAGSAIRIIMDLAGISDITSKSPDSNTPINVIRVAMDGLSKSETRGDVLKLREPAKSLED